LFIATCIKKHCAPPFKTRSELKKWGNANKKTSKPNEAKKFEQCSSY